MSLLFYGRWIARAVAGDLGPPAEAELRQHMRTCARCRERYDDLSAVAEAMGQGRDPGARERQRLTAALNAPDAATKSPAPASRRRWLAAAFVLAPTVALLLWLVPGARRTDITLRGGGPEGAAPSPTLVVYASRRTGPTTRDPVRLAGELPSSGEVHVARADYVQFAIRGLAGPSYVTLIGVDQQGRRRRLSPAGPTPLSPAPSPVMLGPSIDLGGDPTVERYRLYTSVSPSQSADASVFTGVLVIEP